MRYKIIRKDELLKEKFVQVERVQLEIDTYDQKKININRYALVRPEVVAVLIYNPETRQVVLVEQFRYSATKTENGWIKEIVAGLIEPSEDAVQAAKREALEEAGYQLANLEYLQSFYPSLGFSDQIVHLYFAQVSKKDKTKSGGGIIEENEDIKVLEQPFEATMEEMKSGGIKDSKTLIALQWLFIRLNS